MAQPPREEFCTRASLERILPAVRRAIARSRNDPHRGPLMADQAEANWRDLACRFGLAF
jgi:hypothetical protein